MSRILEVLRRSLLLQLLGLVRSTLFVGVLYCCFPVFRLALGILVNSVETPKSLSIETEVFISLLIPLRH